MFVLFLHRVQAPWLSASDVIGKALVYSLPIDQLKNISQVEHSRHRSPVNFVVHLIAGLTAYSHQDKKRGSLISVNRLFWPLDPPGLSRTHVY